MERIKEALDKARAQRESQGRTSAPSTAGQETSPQIEYTQTRRVAIDSTTLNRNRILPGTGDDAATRSYKMLRTQVLQRMLANGWKSLGITSPNAGAGKSLTSINLAISLAKEVSYTVLLVDLDFHNPSLHKYFGHNPNHGLENYLDGKCSLPDVLFNPGFEHLVVLPTTQPVPNSSEILSSPQMLSLVDEMKTRYPSRFALFDLPPVLEFDDVIAFSKNIDAALLVIDEGRTSREEVQRTMDLLKNTPVIGTVLNRSKSTARTSY